MRYTVEQKGQTFLVVGDVGGRVHGAHKTKPEAEFQRKQLQTLADGEMRRIHVHVPKPGESEE